MDVRFAYASNGRGIYKVEMKTAGRMGLPKRNQWVAGEFEPPGK
jgi:hypothetical protein